MDSDRIEAIVDHYLVNGNFSKAKVAADYALTHFSYNHLFHLRKVQALGGLGKLNEALEITDSIENFGMLSFEYFLTKASLFSQLRDSKMPLKIIISRLKQLEMKIWMIFIWILQWNTRTWVILRKR